MWIITIISQSKLEIVHIKLTKSPINFLVFFKTSTFVNVLYFQTYAARSFIASASRNFLHIMVKFCLVYVHSITSTLLFYDSKLELSAWVVKTIFRHSWTRPIFSQINSLLLYFQFRKRFWRPNGWVYFIRNRFFPENQYTF